ncbi:hypothetical protein D3C72_1723230 [compost metagenome]
MVVVDLGVDIARADRIGINAVARPFQRHRLGHVHHGRLAHAVHADLRQHLQPRHRRDIDDARLRQRAAVLLGALGARDHALGHFLGDKEGAAGIGIEDEIEIVGGDVGQFLRG